MAGLGLEDDVAELTSPAPLAPAPASASAAPTSLVGLSLSLSRHATSHAVVLNLLASLATALRTTPPTRDEALSVTHSCLLAVQGIPRDAAVVGQALMVSGAALLAGSLSEQPESIATSAAAAAATTTTTAFSWEAALATARVGAASHPASQGVSAYFAFFVRACVGFSGDSLQAVSRSKEVREYIEKVAATHPTDDFLIDSVTAIRDKLSCEVST